MEPQLPKLLEETLGTPPGLPRPTARVRQLRARAHGSSSDMTDAHRNHNSGMLPQETPVNGTTCPASGTGAIQPTRKKTSCTLPAELQESGSREKWARPRLSWLDHGSSSI